MRAVLSAEQVKKIADRAEARTNAAVSKEYVLRTFICKHCAHEVVVNPELPPDWKPTVCTPCYEKFDKPKNDAAARDLMLKGMALVQMLGHPLPPWVDPEEVRKAGERLAADAKRLNVSAT